MAFGQRLDASEGLLPALEERVSAVEQQLPGMQAARAELHVARTKTGQLGTLSSIYDFAPLVVEMAEAGETADH
eukprot:9309323-Pyramimonas_sp.AAC.1